MERDVSKHIVIIKRCYFPNICNSTRATKTNYKIITFFNTQLSTSMMAHVVNLKKETFKKFEADTEFYKESRKDL